MIQKRTGAEGVRFIVYFKAKGRRFYVGTYDSLKAAKEGEQDFATTRRRIDRGELPEGMDVTKTYREASGDWLESLEKRKARAAGGYGKRVQLYLLPVFGSARLGDVTKARVMDLRDRLALKFAPSTVNGILIALSSSYSYFVDRGWIDRNPCHGVKQVEDPEGAYRWIHTKEEITRLLAACADELRDMVAVTLATGLRIDELLHLEWADIDLTGRLVAVHRGRQGTVKSGRLRHVPILDSVLPLLRARALKRGGDRLIFPGRKGAVRARHGLRTIYKLALKRAGLDTELRWHDLRHTFASHWMMDGGDVFKLSRVLGHANVKQTMRYAHLAPSAFEADYGRLAFHVPTEKAKIVELKRDARGRLMGRSMVSAAAEPSR